mmetsp:Transcript_89/g.103  ORF Transcript_89/g.103 Transcript_89/m.103 type:complete len:95 (-) Transcript_89:31-315(-)
MERVIEEIKYAAPYLFTKFFGERVNCSETTIIFFVVIAVRKLANPYRAIIDAGVIVGLLWGTVSVLLLYLRSLREGKPPDFDPCLPDNTPYSRG